MADSIKVFLRFRPLNHLEREEKSPISIQISDCETSVWIDRGDGKESKSFVFDRIFGWKADQHTVYKTAGEPLVDRILAGYNATIFAYGQTGSGKTWTMDGGASEERQGIIPRMVNDIFNSFEEADEHLDFLVQLSYVEIYKEKVRDLLDNKQKSVRIRQSNDRGVFLENVTNPYVINTKEIFDWIQQGQIGRMVRATNMNEHSSRSHAVVIFRLHATDNRTGSKKTSKLLMVDLAGSEKTRKTKASDEVLGEAKNINKSLSCLGMVINALGTRKQYTPYRNSKLTYLLSDSLGGNSWTTIVITASPASWNVDETISTCRFGTSCKAVKNKPKVNKEISIREVKMLVIQGKKREEKLMEEIQALKLENRELKKALEIATAGEEKPLEQSSSSSNDTQASKSSTIRWIDDRTPKQKESNNKEPSQRSKYVASPRTQRRKRWRQPLKSKPHTVHVSIGAKEVFAGVASVSSPYVRNSQLEMENLLKERVEQLEGANAELELIKKELNEEVASLKDDLESELLQQQDLKEEIDDLQEKIAQEIKEKQEIQSELSNYDTVKQQWVLRQKEIDLQTKTYEHEIKELKLELQRYQQKFSALPRTRSVGLDPPVSLSPKMDAKMDELVLSRENSNHWKSRSMSSLTPRIERSISDVSLTSTNTLPMPPISRIAESPTKNKDLVIPFVHEVKPQLSKVKSDSGLKQMIKTKKSPKSKSKYKHLLATYRKHWERHEALKRQFKATGEDYQVKFQQMREILKLKESISNEYQEQLRKQEKAIAWAAQEANSVRKASNKKITAMSSEMKTLRGYLRQLLMKKAEGTRGKPHVIRGGRTKTKIMRSNSNDAVTTEFTEFAIGDIL